MHSRTLVCTTANSDFRTRMFMLWTGAASVVRVSQSHEAPARPLLHPCVWYVVRQSIVRRLPWEHVAVELLNPMLDRTPVRVKDTQRGAIN